MFRSALLRACTRSLATRVGTGAVVLCTLLIAGFGLANFAIAKHDGHHGYGHSGKGKHHKQTDAGDTSDQTQTTTRPAVAKPPASSGQHSGESHGSIAGGTARPPKAKPKGGKGHGNGHDGRGHHGGQGSGHGHHHSGGGSSDGGSSDGGSTGGGRPSEQPPSEPPTSSPPPSEPPASQPPVESPPAGSRTPLPKPTVSAPQLLPLAQLRKPQSARRERPQPARPSPGLFASQGLNAFSHAAGAGAAGARLTSTSAAGIAKPAAGRADRSSAPRHGHPRETGSPVTRTVRDIVEVVPDSVKTALAGLAALAALLAAGYGFTAFRARRVRRQRRELLEEVGLLQAALLPPVPERFGALRVSVAYRPADGPAAGGDFYDALPLAGGRTGFILGDVSGHGRPALARTAFLRYTLRAYLEAGLQPRAALRLAGQVIDDLEGDFATVLIAVHDPLTGSLTYAAAGHPAPIVVGPSRFEPVLAASAPPIGAGLDTGLRQTVVPLSPGSVACMYTDGLTEARTEKGILGRGRLGDVLEELGRGATAPELLERVAGEARLVSDDMATVLLAPTAGATAGDFRSEQLELPARDLPKPLAGRFLEACGVPSAVAHEAVLRARAEGERGSGALLQVRYGIRRPIVEVLPANLESFEAASQRAHLAQPAFG